MDDSVGLILKAIRFAADKHMDQRRKDSKSSPYINHPIQVAETLWTVGEVRDLTLLVASILHDTVEDTNTKPDEIQAEFGEEVLALILEVTDDKSLPKQVRKQLQVETAPHKTRSAKLLKLADKICNVHDILASPPAHWSLERQREYLLWTEKVVAGLRGVNARLENHYCKVCAQPLTVVALGRNLALPSKPDTTPFIALTRVKWVLRLRQNGVVKYFLRNQQSRYREKPGVDCDHFMMIAAMIPYPCGF